jgi:hypothetical protein
LSWKVRAGIGKGFVRVRVRVRVRVKVETRVVLELDRLFLDSHCNHKYGYLTIQIVIVEKNCDLKAKQRPHNNKTRQAKRRKETRR